MWYWHKNRHVEQLNHIKDPNVTQLYMKTQKKSRIAKIVLNNKRTAGEYHQPRLQVLLKIYCNENSERTAPPLSAAGAS